MSVVPKYWNHKCFHMFETLYFTRIFFFKEKNSRLKLKEKEKKGKKHILNISTLAWTRPQRGWISPLSAPSLSTTQMCLRHNSPWCLVSLLLFQGYSITVKKNITLDKHTHSEYSKLGFTGKSKDWLCIQALMMSWQKLF